MAMGGVGEAMLLGAAMGGGSAMLTGGDPLKGALMGGLTGGAGAGASEFLKTALTPSVSLAEVPLVTGAATPAITEAVAPAITEAATTTAANLPNAVTPSGLASIPNGLPPDISQSILRQTVPNVPMVAPAAAPVVSAAPNVINSMPPSYGDLFGSGSSTLPGISTTAPVAPPAGNSFLEGMKRFTDSPLTSIMNNKFTAGASALAGASQKKKKEEEEKYSGPLSRFKYNPDAYQPSGYADGGIATLASGGYDRMVGEEPMYTSNMALGGIANLGSYSDGGRMLRGPGDGMSDSIPATIGGRRPARLADGEFVVPADVVSHLGNGSTDAGAKHLYAMMDKVRQARTGRKTQGREINPRQYVPA